MPLQQGAQKCDHFKLSDNLLFSHYPMKSRGLDWIKSARKKVNKLKKVKFWVHNFDGHIIKIQLNTSESEIILEISTPLLICEAIDSFFCPLLQ